MVGVYPLNTSKTVRPISVRKADKKPARPTAIESCYTLTDFNREFPDDNACLEYIKEQRWPNGVTKCEKCNCDRKHYRVTGRTAYACDHCGNHVYPLTGTVFSKSTTPLKIWFYVMYLMGATRCGMSAKRIQRETGVTYKTAWRTLVQIRRLLDNEDLQQLECPAAEVPCQKESRLPGNTSRREQVQREPEILTGSLG